MLSHFGKGLHRSLSKSVVPDEAWGLRLIQKLAEDYSVSFISLPPVSFDEESGPPSGGLLPSSALRPSLSRSGLSYQLQKANGLSKCSSAVAEEERPACIRSMQKPPGEGEEGPPLGRWAPASDWSERSSAGGSAAAAAQDGCCTVAGTSAPACHR